MIYDITQEFFSAPVYPGDPVPTATPFRAIASGDACNLTVLHFGSHAATHIDAPRHFVADGKTVEQISLETVIGPCVVVSVSKLAGAEELAPYLTQGARVLLRGCDGITPEAASLAVRRGVILLGLKGQSVGDHAVHRTILGAEIAVLEGLALQEVPDGAYRLIALPVKLGGLDGAPVRAVLLNEDEK